MAMCRICVLSIDRGVKRADDMVINLFSLALARDFALSLHACMLPRCRLLLLLVHGFCGQHMVWMLITTHATDNTIIFIFVEDGVRQQVLLLRLVMIKMLLAARTNWCHIVRGSITKLNLSRQPHMRSFILLGEKVIDSTLNHRVLEVRGLDLCEHFSIFTPSLMLKLRLLLLMWVNLLRWTGRKVQVWLRCIDGRNAILSASHDIVR